MGLLRLLLALSVVAVHCGSVWKFKFVGGQIAVQSFYIISGFYMTLILNEKYGPGNKSFKLFITNRILRLYPIYWVVLIATVVTCLLIGFANNWDTIPKFDFYKSIAFNLKTYALLILSNLFIVGQDLVMFLGVIPDTGKLYFTTNFKNSSSPLYNFLFLEQAWTLGIEIMFYLIAPFFVRRNLKIITSVILLSIIARFIIYNYFNLKHDPWTYRFFPAEIAFFLLGTVSYHLYKAIKSRLINSKVFITIFLFVIGITVLYPFLPGIKFSFMPFTLKEVFYFFLLVVSIPFLFIYLKDNRFDNQLGELSYPVYISHLFVALAISNFSNYSPSYGWVIAIITIVLSFILNKTVSDPIDRYRQLRVVKFKNSINKF